MIKINDEYFFESDGFCLTLKQEFIVKKGKNAGKKYFRIVGHFSVDRLDVMFDYLTGHNLVGAESLDDVIKSFNALREDIQKLKLRGLTRA